MKIAKFDKLVKSFSKLPGVGKKTAFRYAYFVSLQDVNIGMNIADEIKDAINSLKKCNECGCLCENECEICSDEMREKTTVCIVASPKDIFSIEESGAYNGVYFVIENLNEDKILQLELICKKNNVKEIIFALTPSISSDAMSLYIEDKLKDLNINFTRIAQGVPTGMSLENIDILSLNKAIKDRQKI